MIAVENIKQFVSNDFNDAVLSGRIKDGKLDLRLFLKEKIKISYDSIPCYSSDLGKLKNNAHKLCNYLLDMYLQNNEVIGINYFCYNPHHSDKNCFEIITTNGTLTLAFSTEIVINDLFPNFVNKIESAKQNGIISVLEKLKNVPMEHGYTKDEVDLGLYDKFKTGLTLYNSKEIMMNGKLSNKGHYRFSYQVLKILNRDGKIIIPDYEKKFLIILVKELLEFTKSQKQFDFIIEDIDRILSDIELGCRIFGQHTLNFGHLVSVYHSRISSSLESLRLMKEIIVELEPYFRAKEPEDVKQLILTEWLDLKVK